MSDIQRGITFTTSIPDAASAHQLVDAAVILPAFISDKASAAPATGDTFVFNKNGALRKCTLQQLISAFPNGGAANVFALRKLGTSAQTAAAGNDPRFPAQITGIRKANGTSPDTAATAKDFNLASKNLAGLTTIDWDVANVFRDSITANKTYNFANVRDGRTITLVIEHNNHITAFNAAIHLGNLALTLIPSPAPYRIYVFTRAGTITMGWTFDA